MHSLKLLAGIALACSAVVTQAQQMDIYWIDADGAAATLIVTPARQVVLVDSAFNRPGDIYSHRIRAVMEDAGVAHIDYFIATHYHGDHIGGITALADMVPVAEFIDHGETTLTDERGIASYQRYVDTTASGKRTSATPGTTLPLDGVTLTIVASNKETIGHSLHSSDPNTLCSTADPGPDFDGEDIYSVGFHLSMGDFDFANTGDLSYRGLHNLVCPINRLGAIDLLDYPHHGNDVAPHYVASLAPIAAVSSGGAHKGGSPEGFEAAAASPGLQGYWQLHRALDSDDAHNTEPRKTANLTEENDQAHWIKAEVNADGSRFTVTNTRNQYSETYSTR